MIEVERIGPEGWEIYRELRLAALADAPSAFGARTEVERHTLEAEWRERLATRTQFVARTEGVPSGTVGCRADAGSPPEVVSMWVAPGERGTGVGDLLLEAVLADTRARGHATLTLWVTDGNERAERFYGRHGFSRTGRVQLVDDADPARGAEFEMRRDD